VLQWTRASIPTLLTLCLISLLGLPGARLGAQTSQTGALQGTVVIPNGRPVANVLVTLQRVDGSYPRSSQTNEFGEFRINFIAPGTYELATRLIGYRPVVMANVTVQASDVQRLVITLTPSRTELEAVQVTAGEALVSTSNTEFTSSLRARERELLPAARDANALVNFTPGARPNQVFGGSDAQANTYQLDGVTVNQPGVGGAFLLPNVDWIEDFKVIGLGAGAEYGNFQGGLINIVTKSGSNTRQGHVRTFFEHRALNASNTNATEAGSELDNRFEFNGEVRGPIIRDKLYYYLSAQESQSGNRVVDQRSATAGNVSYLGTLAERREQKYYGKLTYQAGPRDIVNASLGYDNVTRERVGLSGFNDISATTQGRSPSAFYQANWQRTLSNNRFFELKVSGYSGQDNELPYNGANVPAVVLLDAPNAPQFNNAYYTRRNSPSSLGLSAMYDTYFNTIGWLHNLKLGGEYVFGSWLERRTRNGDLTWYTEAGENFDASNPATWQTIPSLGVYATTDTGGRIDLNANTRNAALYLQDYIRINDHLSINAGVRFNQWQGLIKPGNGGSSRGEGRFTAVNANAFDPRVGATVDVFGNASLVAKAHWGRFHQSMFALLFDRAPGANVFTNIDFCDWNNLDKSVLPELGKQYSRGEFGQLFTCFPGSNLANEAEAIEDYQQPYMDQITLSLEKSIGRQLKASVLYINRQNKSILSLVDTRINRSWVPINNVRVSDERGAVKDPDGRDLVLPVIYVRGDDIRARLRAGDNIPGYSLLDTSQLFYEPLFVLRPVDEAQRDFSQIQLALQGDYARVSFNAAIAFTQLTGNVFSVNGYVSQTGEGVGPFAEKNAQINYQGNLPNFSPWDIKLRASGQLPWGFEGGAFFTYIAGDYWAPSLSVSRQLRYDVENPDGSLTPLSDELFRNSSGQFVLTEPRGSRQFSGQANLDVRLQRVFTVGRNDLILGVEAFNLFNGSAATAVNQVLNNQDPATPSSLAGAVRARQAPMTFRLNVQYRL
jgi:hypothetical protein